MSKKNIGFVIYFIEQIQRMQQNRLWWENKAFLYVGILKIKILHFKDTKIKQF